MILLPCPWCGPRNSAEFRYVGEPTPRPGPDATSQQWRRYLYVRSNLKGWVTENWYHRAGCRRYISVQRHTETNQTRAVAGGSR